MTGVCITGVVMEMEVNQEGPNCFHATCIMAQCMSSSCLNGICMVWGILLKPILAEASCFTSLNYKF